MLLRSLWIILTGAILTFSVFAQNVGFERSRYKGILSKVRDDVQKHYFDPSFKGIDLNAKYKTAQEKINSATTVSQMNTVIAQFLLDFDDSHLFYIPPGKANKTKYGFDFRMFGDKCLVYKVDKDSDAAKKGLEVGDEIHLLEGFAPDRAGLWKMNYFYRALSPRAALKLDIAKPDGKSLQISVAAKIEPGKRFQDLTSDDAFFDFIREQENLADKSLSSHKFYDKIEGVYIWKMPEFDMEPSKVDEMIGKASKSKAIIFDLRDNGGGRVDMLLRLIANVFDKDIDVADEKKRKETKKSNRQVERKRFF